MNRIITICLIALLPVFSKAQERLQVNVHPGVELLTIIQILAERYPPPNPSAYSQDFKAYFEKYKDHPAVKKAASLKKVFTDLTELGWCMSDFPNIKIYEPKESVWYDLNGRDNIIEYLKLCRDFFNDTHFWDFYKQHEQQYLAWAASLKAKVDSAQLVQRLQDFYRFDSNVHWFICIDPLNSWGSHAIMTKVINPAFADYIVYNTGYFNRNGSTLNQPYFEFKNFDNLVWHEGSHVYINGLMKKYEKEINELSYLFNKNDEGMIRNNISNWAYCLDENIVRSVTACLYKQYRTPREFKRQVAREIGSDFIYVEDLTPFIYDHYFKSHRYKNFADFFPKILSYLKNKYPKLS